MAGSVEAKESETGNLPPDDGPAVSISWHKKLLFSTVLSVGSLAVGLVAGEMLVRLVAPQQLIMIRPDIWASVDTLGWRHASNLQTQVNTGERTVSLFTDSEGFRVGEQGRRMTSDSILIIGDSFMAALQVEYEQSLAGLIEDSLTGPDGQHVAVRNTGVGAWGPQHYLMMARRRLARRTYGLTLVAVYVGNDVVSQRVEYFPSRSIGERAQFRIPWELSVEAWIEDVARPINDFLESRSHLFVFFKNRTEPFRIRLGLSPLSLPSGIRRDRASAEMWRVTVDILEDVAAVADSARVPTLFVLIPARYQVDEDLFSRNAEAFGIDTAGVDLSQPNDILREGLEARGLNVIDALPHLRSAFHNGAELYGSVDPHFSPSGHAALFDLLRGPIEGTLGWR